MTTLVRATYFDGISSLRHEVEVALEKRVLGLRGDGLKRKERLSKLDISERLEHAPRIVRFPDGAYFETRDPNFDLLLARNGFRDPWVVRWQQNWPLSLGALVLVVGSLLAGYQWGLPWAADRIAQRLPAALERKIGDGGLEMIDKTYFAPSRLDPERRARIVRQFAEMQQPRGEKTAYRIEFRDSKIGPNAFALPNGVIVMTDQLVEVAPDDRAVLGVLSHELGHLQRRHSLRGMLQAAGTGAAMHLLVGDVSSVLAAVPTFLLDRKYSRDFEREADQYAIDMMQENGQPLSPMADLFEKMGAAAGKPGAPGADAQRGGQADDDVDEDDDDEDGGAPQRGPQPGQRPGQAPRRAAVPDYFSSHPSDAERIARLRQADKQ